jgi:hypothetical protein
LGKGSHLSALETCADAGGDTTLCPLRPIIVIIIKKQNKLIYSRARLFRSAENLVQVRVDVGAGEAAVDVFEAGPNVFHDFEPLTGVVAAGLDKVYYPVFKQGLARSRRHIGEGLNFFSDNKIKEFYSYHFRVDGLSFGRVF